MFQARDRLKRVQLRSRNLYRVTAIALVVSLCAVAAPSPAATPPPRPLRVADAAVVKTLEVRHVRVHHRPSAVTVDLATFTSAPTPTQGYVVTLIHQDFPASAWRDAEDVAWCESKFRPTDIGFDSNGTHDRGVFQLNDGGTEQYLMQMIGQNPNNLNLAFNPVLNVKAAALLYARDGWSQWSCASAIP